MTDLFVILDFDTYWQHGTGALGEGDVDLSADRDRHGLPILRGRHVQGILRAASIRLDQWHPAPIGPLTDILFGSRNKAEPGPSKPGCLNVSDFCLPEHLSAHKTALFRRLASTRINELTGTAMDQSLRAVEVAAPVPLGGTIRWIPERRLVLCPEEASDINAAHDHWIAHLTRCLIDARAFGAKRTRGFGRTRFDPNKHLIELHENHGGTTA